MKNKLATQSRLLCTIAIIALLGFLLACSSPDNHPAHEHQWGDWRVTKTATCMATGIKTRVCALDATHTETETIPINPTAHVWGEWEAETEPTCTEKGKGSRICTLNSSHTETNVDIPIDPIAHQWGSWAQTIAPTCTTVGIDTRTCNHNKTHKETRTGAAALGHDYGNWTVIKAATYTEEGAETITCNHDATHKETRIISKIPIIFTAVSNSTFDTNEYSFISAIAYGNGKFVAGDYFGKRAWSTDGVTWTAVDTDTLFYYDGFLGNISAIAYGNGKFVAVGGGSKIAYSTDGTTWTAVSGSPFVDPLPFFAIAYGSIGSNVVYFFAGSSYGQMAYSQDGVTWNKAFTINAFPIDINCQINAIAYGNGKFVAVGRGKIAYFTDGTGWISVSGGIFTNSLFGPNYYSNINAIAYGNGKFVACAASGRMATSTDGATWTAIDTGTIFEGYYSIAYGNNKFVVFGAGGEMAVSTDGVIWTAVTDSKFGTDTIRAIAYGNGKFVAVGNSGKMAYWEDN